MTQPPWTNGARYLWLFRSGCLASVILVPVALFDLFRFSPSPKVGIDGSGDMCGLLALVALGAFLLVLGIATELSGVLFVHRGRLWHARRLLGFLACAALVVSSQVTSIRWWVRTELHAPNWRRIAEGRTDSVVYDRIGRGLPISCRQGLLGAVVVIPKKRDVVEFAGVIEEWPDGYANVLALARSDMHTADEVAAAFGNGVSARRYRGRWFYVNGL